MRRRAPRCLERRRGDSARKAALLSRILILELHRGKHVRSQRLLRILDLDRYVEQRLETLTHEKFAQLTAHKD